MHAFGQKTVVNLVSVKQKLLCKAASRRIILQELTSLHYLVCQYLQIVSLSKDLFIWFWRLMLFQVILWLLCTRVHWEVIKVSCAEKGSVFKLVNLLTSELVNTLSLSLHLFRSGNCWRRVARLKNTVWIRKHGNGPRVWPENTRTSFSRNGWGVTETIWFWFVILKILM